MIIKILAVACGGALGSLGRYLIALGAEKVGPFPFPYGTLAANILGCLLMGFCWGHFEKIPISNEFRLFVFTGFLGGFTTFSTFARETAGFIKGHEPIQAAGYLLISNGIGISAVIVGLFLAGRMWR